MFLFYLKTNKKETINVAKKDEENRAPVDQTSQGQGEQKTETSEDNNSNNNNPAQEQNKSTTGNMMKIFMNLMNFLKLTRSKQSIDEG